jgi:hypothetical protein
MCERMLIIDRNKQASRFMYYGLTNSPDISCDDRLAERHRLQKHHGQPFRAARQAGDVRRVNEIGRIQSLTEDLDHAAVVTQPLEIVELWAATHDQAPNLSIDSVCPLHSTEEDRRSLFRTESSDENSYEITGFDSKPRSHG